MQNTTTESTVLAVRSTLTDKIKDMEGISGIYLLDRIEGLGVYQQTKRQITSIFFGYLLNNEGDPAEAAKFDVWALHDSFQVILDKLYLERQEGILEASKATLATVSENSKHH